MLLVCGLALGLAGCGGGGIGSGNLFGGGRKAAPADATTETAAAAESRIPVTRDAADDRESAQNSIFNLFGGNADANTTVEVNKYLWAASLDVLNFLPIETVDPFTGVIVTGYGAPPGGGRAYRATIYIQDPALDARSLRVALQARGGGAVSREVSKAVEDAILTRARQLRVQDSRL
jgi:hypothetical protein